MDYLNAGRHMIARQIITYPWHLSVVARNYGTLGYQIIKHSIPSTVQKGQFVPNA